ncbi:MAG: hypothetical protein IKB72_05040 [Ruminococcus sp.]|nr:hypothetical protein [Ruminococcus sp.]
MISPNDHSNDPAYKLKEVTFFMDHFRKQSYDDIATMIAKDMGCFLKADGDYHDIIDYLVELEDYSKRATKQDYVWELVYIRRTSARKQGESLKEALFASDCVMKAAEHFDTICKLEPSLYNLCCRIQEYLIANDWFDNPLLQVIAGKIKQRNLAYCEKCFKEIEEQDESMYYQTGYYLYIDLYLSSKEEAEESVQFGYLSRLLSFAMKYFEEDTYYPALKNLLIAYKEATYYSEFSYAKEMENINKVIRWANLAILDGHSDMESSCVFLKQRIAQIKSSTDG